MWYLVVEGRIADVDHGVQVGVDASKDIPDTDEGSPIKELQLEVAREKRRLEIYPNGCDALVGKRGFIFVFGFWGD
jgi:hypothetical protein